MAGEEDLMEQVEELKMEQVEELKMELREAEEGREEMRRGSKEARVGGESRGREEARGGEYRVRGSGAGGFASRTMGSAMLVGLQGQEDMHVELQSQMVAAEVVFFRVLKVQWAGRWALHCM